jgi:hypothetical protein
METINEYHKQADDFLVAAKIEYGAVNVGQRKLDWGDEDRGAVNMYVCTFKRKGKSISFDFYSSIHDTEITNASLSQWYPVTICGKVFKTSKGLSQAKQDARHHAYDLLYCLQKYDPGIFDDWCLELGYDPDSTKAFKTYQAVCEEWIKVRSFFTSAELEQIQEIN